MAHDPHRAGRARTARARGSGRRCRPPRVYDVALAPLSAEDSRPLLDNLIGAGICPQVRAPDPAAHRGQSVLPRGGHARADRRRHAGARTARGQLSPVATRSRGLAIPDTVQGVIVARIDRLEEASRGAEARRGDRPQLFPAHAEGDLRGPDESRAGLGRLEAGRADPLRQQRCPSSNTSSSMRWCRRRPTAESWPSADAPFIGAWQAIESLFPERLDEFASLLAHHYASRKTGRRHTPSCSRPATRPAAWPPTPRRWSTSAGPKRRT